MSVNEEEAATSAPADVILLEGGEKGKDEKIKYTSLMETTLLSVVIELQAHRYGSKSWPGVIEKLGKDKDFKFLATKNVESKEGLEKVIKSLKRKVSDVCDRCEKVMERGNKSALPGGSMTDLFKYAEKISNDKSHDNAVSDETRQADQRHKQFLDATAKTILGGGAAVKKGKRKRNESLQPLPAGGDTTSSSKKVLKGGNHPLREKQLDGSIKDLRDSNKSSIRMSLEERVISSLFKLDENEKKTVGDNDEDETVTERNLNRWSNENLKSMADFILEAKIPIDLEKSFDSFDLDLLFSVYCAKGSKFRADAFVQSMKDLGCAAMACQRAHMLLKRWAAEASSFSNKRTPSAVVSASLAPISAQGSSSGGGGNNSSSTAEKRCFKVNDLLSEDDDEDSTTSTSSNEQN